MNHCVPTHRHTLAFLGPGLVDPDLPRLGTITFESKIEHTGDAVAILKQGIGHWVRDTIQGNLATEGGTVFTLQKLVENNAFVDVSLIQILEEKGIRVLGAHVRESNFRMPIDASLVDPKTRAHFTALKTTEEAD